MAAAVTMLDVSFPVEIQTLRTPHKSQGSSNGATEDDVRMDNVHLRVVLEGTDMYQVSLWSATDVFFNLINKVSRDSFDVLRRDQQLVVGFEGFPTALKKLLTACVTERVSHAALIVIEEDAVSLHIVCKMEHKIVELLAFPFQKVSGKELEELVQSRFTELHARLEAAQAKVAEFSSMVRSGKVPSLLNRPVQHGHHKGGW